MELSCGSIAAQLLMMAVVFEGKKVARNGDQCGDEYGRVVSFVCLFVY